MPKIHPTAVVEEGALLEANVEVGPFCFISKEVKIGEGTRIAQGAHVCGNTTIGKHNEIFSHAVLGSIPQDLKYAGEEVELIIGDYNKIREFTLFNPGTLGGGNKTVIGNHNLFMGYVHIGHDVHVGDHCILANAATLAGHVEIGNYTVIGGMTPIHQFVKIGDFAMIAGASALSQDIPPSCLAEGNRAVLRGLNLNGLRRHFERADIDALRLAYRKLFESGQPLQETAASLLANESNEKVLQMCRFIVESTRGIPFERKNNGE